MKNKFWNVVKNDEKTGELYLYGDISAHDSWWEEDGRVTPKGLIDDLKDLGDIDTLHLYINSSGGEVFAGQAIYNIIKRHKARVITYIDGLAASIASVIALAGDEVNISKNAMMMIHNPWTWGGFGDAKSLRKKADTLDQIRESILVTYSEKTGLTNDDIIAMMDVETWFTADEAKNKGFVDNITNTMVEASMQSNNLFYNGISIDLKGFKNFPKENWTDYIPPSSNNPSQGSFSNFKNQGGKKMKLTIEELQKEHPELFNSIKNQGVMEERRRIQKLEELAVPGVENLLFKAKFETGDAPEKVAMAIIKAQKEEGQNYLAKVQKDVEISNVNKVPGDEPPVSNDAEILNSWKKAVKDGATRQKQPSWR